MERMNLLEAMRIESFWGYAKIRLVKFKGMNKKMFNLLLKECEFSFQPSE
jgi:transposase-like protein